MVFTENETTELKSTYTDDIRKEILAFANTRGGKIYIGVEDDGSICGVSNPDTIIQKISNSLRDTVKPDITMFLCFKTKSVSKKKIIEIDVQCGTHKPYYIASKGLRPEGVYVRQATSSVPASDFAIRQMIKDTDGDNYEDMRSLNQQLTFNKLSDEFKKRKLDFKKKQMKTLGLTDNSGLYTNLALLLSDQCPHIIKAATFAENDKSNFQDRFEFTGSLLQQLEDAYKYLDMRNNTRATFSGMYREDHFDYPDVAIREALLNAIVHRDYSVSASILISVYQNRIEIISVGGLAGGISYDDMMLGVSYCRNKKLADVFYRMKLIEAYGTGIEKIMSSYSGSKEKPDVKVSSGAYKITLPNLNEPEDEDDSTPSGTLGPNKNIEKTYSMFRKRKMLTRAEIEAALGVSTSTARRIIEQLLLAGLIKKYGSTRAAVYELVRK